MLTSSNIKTKINVFWFRRDLRLDDNTGLFNALNGPLPVLPIFIFDSYILDNLKNKNDLRINFIYQNLQTIDTYLKGIGSGLLILTGKPENIWQELTTDLDIESVFFNHDYEPYAIERDTIVTEVLSSKGINVFSFKDQVIFEKSEIIKDDGSPYTVFTPFSKKWKNLLTISQLNPYPSENKTDTFLKTSLPALPEIKDIGFETTNIPFSKPVIDEEIIAHYHETRDYPPIDGTSRLSVHLRFGTVSVRKLVREALQLNETWLNELIWREFFMMILFHFPHVVDSPFKKKYKGISWSNDEKDFAHWCAGTTGFPLVDAGMRELNATGYMHNRVRMITAGFLTKHLLIDWRWGEKYFAQKLLDYDLAANNGNWQWAAGCGCDAAPYFRIFNPMTQAKKFDPDQIYIKKWIPEYGTNKYPAPIIDHTFARERALRTYKNVI